MKRLSILGSTGSIGTQALEIVRRYPERFKIAALAAHKNTELLIAQCREFMPSLAAITDESAYHAAKNLFPAGIRVVGGADALETAACLDEADTVVAAVVGCEGFSGVYEAVKRGKTIALANKESLVSGGKLIMNLARETAAAVLPVDSEHSAVWQCLMGSEKLGVRSEECLIGRRIKSTRRCVPQKSEIPNSSSLIPHDSKNLRRIILTASGGAFYGKTRDELARVTPEEATRHPNWQMGKKITVDSSTMMNKGLEIVEARWLFDTFDIDYIIHRESIIHSMVEFSDGTLLMQASYPSMEYPIQFALTYPDRLPASLPRYDFSKPLTFAPPDEQTFILPRLAKEALRAHEGAPLVLNAANEAAVSLFLNNRIGFVHIFDIVQNAMQSAEFPVLTDKKSVIAAHRLWHEKVLSDYKRFI